MIGVCGAHRTGKTTLAQTLSECTGIPFLRSDVSGTFERLGVSPQAEMHLASRLEVQIQILDDLQDQYMSSPSGNFITDRTPVDVAAYLVADITRASTDGCPSVDDEVARFVTRAVEMTFAHFEMVILVQPGLELEEDPKKAQCSKAYIEHLNDIMISLLLGRDDDAPTSKVVMLRRYITGLQERTQVILDVMWDTFPNHILLQENVSLQ